MKESVKKIVVFTGAGVSADSGLSTFRDADGSVGQIPHRGRLHARGPGPQHGQLVDRVLQHPAAQSCFRKQSERRPPRHPPAGGSFRRRRDHPEHRRPARAGRQLARVTHLHGELRKLRSSIDETAHRPDRRLGAGARPPRCPDGSLLRPFVVFFGGERTDVRPGGAHRRDGRPDRSIVGTSLAVYPAASLVACTSGPTCPSTLVDPGQPDTCAASATPLEAYPGRAPPQGMPLLADRLIEEYGGRTSV